MEMVEKMMAKFDITGQGTILDVERRPSQPVIKPPTLRTTSESSLPVPADEHAAKGHHKRAPNHKQQLKHALTVNAAHVITIDYLTLSQPLSEGILLMNRTEKKLTLVHSLGELKPLHVYTTEYGNTLERVSKHRAVLAGSIELDVETDEAHFDEALEAASLAPTRKQTLQPCQKGPRTPPTPRLRGLAIHLAQLIGMYCHEYWPIQLHIHLRNKCLSRSTTRTLHAPERMATYHAFTSNKGVQQSQSAPTIDDDNVSVCDEPSRLQEIEAMRRISALVSRMGEMEDWFKSVKAEAVSERSMREMANVRLQVVQERLERMQEQLIALQKENHLLRERLVDVQLADRVQAGETGHSAGFKFSTF